MEILCSHTELCASNRCITGVRLTDIIQNQAQKKVPRTVFKSSLNSVIVHRCDSIHSSKVRNKETSNSSALN